MVHPECGVDCVAQQGAVSGACVYSRDEKMLCNTYVIP